MANYSGHMQLAKSSHIPNESTANVQTAITKGHKHSTKPLNLAHTNNKKFCAKNLVQNTNKDCTTSETSLIQHDDKPNKQPKRVKENPQNSLTCTKQKQEKDILKPLLHL